MKKINPIISIINNQKSKIVFDLYEKNLNKIFRLFNSELKQEINKFCVKCLKIQSYEAREILKNNNLIKINFLKIFFEKIIIEINMHLNIWENMNDSYRSFSNLSLIEEYKFELSERKNFKYEILDINCLFCPKINGFNQNFYFDFNIDYLKFLKSKKEEAENNFLTTIDRFAEINLYDWVNISESGDKALNFDNWAFIPKDEKLLIDQCDKKEQTMLYKTIADFYQAETIKQKEEKLLSLIKDLEPEWSVNLNDNYDKYPMFNASNKEWWQQKKWACHLVRHNSENPNHERLYRLSKEEKELTNWYKYSSDEEKTKFLIDILRFLLILKMYKTNPELDLKEVFKPTQ